MRVEVKENKRGNVIWTGTSYILEVIVNVYDDNDDLILSSKNKTEQEFFNYLSFLCSEQDIEFIKERYYGTNNDYVFDYDDWDDCADYMHDDEDWDY